MKNYIFLLLLLPLGTFAQPWARQYDFVDDCICGMAKVSKAGKFGYVDRQGKLVVPLEYDEALTFSEGLAAVCKGGRWGFIDSTGIIRVAPCYEDAASFHEGLAAVKKGGKYGYITTDFVWAVPCEYTLAGRFSEGIAPVANNHDLWGYINVKGKTVIGFYYSYADVFTDGVARVMKGSSMKFIDRYGKEVPGQ
jgi:hypothetical protein